jgi:hypothetical protein
MKIRNFVTSVAMFALAIGPALAATENSAPEIDAGQGLAAMALLACAALIARERLRRGN